MNNRLKGYRNMAGITQMEMAKRIGIKATTYSFKETGKSDFTQTEMFKIMEVLKEGNSELRMEDVFLKMQSAKCGKCS